MQWPRLKNSLHLQWFPRIVLNPSWEHPTQTSPCFLQGISKTPQTKQCENYVLQSVPSYIFFITLPRNFVREFQQQNLHYGSVVTCTTTHTYMELFYSSRRLNSLRLALFSQSNVTEIKHFYYLYLLLCTAISVHSTQRISRCFANDICTGIPSTLKCPGLEGGLQPRK